MRIFPEFEDFLVSYGSYHHNSVYLMTNNQNLGIN